jgi:hypothetical protein
LITQATFGSEPQPVDGCHFDGCTFNGTVLVYSGGERPQFSRCTFNSVTWKFEGAAGNTLEFLRGMYKSGFAPVVEGTLQYIKHEL